jgi:hypothetical protein
MHGDRLESPAVASHPLRLGKAMTTIAECAIVRCRKRLCSVKALGQRVPPLQLPLKHNARDCVIVCMAKRDERRSHASLCGESFGWT